MVLLYHTWPYLALFSLRYCLRNLPKVQYEGAESTNPYAFKFYDAERMILGKPMKEHLHFAMAWWHNLCATGSDMFGMSTGDKCFGAVPGTMEHAYAKVDAGFEFMDKLGIEYFCLHDVDIVPEVDTIEETNRRLDEITDYIKEKMAKHGKKLLWDTANMFGNPRHMNGAGSTNSADVYCFAAAQVKKALELTVKLGGTGYVFWGGREGYETLWNTDMKLEQENISALMRMAVDYGRKIGFEGDFFIEPKPKEPMKHQYLEDGRLELSNNRAERSIKPFVMGRKDWLFANTPAGAQSSAVIYSLIETAKESGLDPYRYLVWVLKSAPSLSQVDEVWADKLLPALAPQVCKVP